MQPVDLANAALLRCNAKAQLTASATGAIQLDGSVEATACNAFLNDAISDALTAYPWRFATRIGVLTAAPSSSNPAWANEFAKPGDCLKVLGVVDPNIPSGCYQHSLDLFQQGMPFDEGIGAASGTPGPVLWSNLALCEPNNATPSLSTIYTSGALVIDQWPASFRKLVEWMLAAEIVLPVTGNAQMKPALDAAAEEQMQKAIQADSPRSFQSTEYLPDWMAVRECGPEYWLPPMTSTIGTFSSGFAQDIGPSAADQAAVPPAPAMLPGAPGILPAGIDPAQFGAGQRGGYIPAWTPDGRIGVFAIGESPIAWRRPYHGEILFPGAPAVVGSMSVDDVVGGGPTGSGEIEVL